MFMGHSEDMRVTLRRCFLIFQLISSLKVNMGKSCLVRVRVDLTVVSDIVSVFGCHIGSLPMKYLGL